MKGRIRKLNEIMTRRLGDSKTRAKTSTGRRMYVRTQIREGSENAERMDVNDKYAHDDAGHEGQTMRWKT